MNTNELDYLDNDEQREAEESAAAAQQAAAHAEAERIRKENEYVNAMLDRDKVESYAMRNATDLSTQGGSLSVAQANYLANRRKS